jgi:protease I
MAKTVALMIASVGFQPMEYGVTKKILENNGYTVLTTSNAAGTAQSSVSGIVAAVDLPVQQLELDTIDGIFLIGGPGCLEHLDTLEIHDIIKSFYERGKPLGAICIAPRIFANAGILTGKRATGWDGDNQLAQFFKERGVNYVRESCVVDDTIITATDPQATQEFAENIITVFETSVYDQ